MSIRFLFILPSRSFLFSYFLFFYFLFLPIIHSQVFMSHPHPFAAPLCISSFHIPVLGASAFGRTTTAAVYRPPPRPPLASLPSAPKAVIALPGWPGSATGVVEIFIRGELLRAHTSGHLQLRCRSTAISTAPRLHRC
jgi:hypothetical protein